jgi:hypothetical protein
MSASADPLSGDFPAQWRPIGRHSADKPPLNEVREPLNEVRVRGDATAEEVVAVLAVLGRAVPAGVAAGPSGYELWRRGRLHALANGSVSPRATSDTVRPD